MGEEKCKICESKPAKYNCPRCNILYCSVNCYKSQYHQECSEGFYRENVIQELTLRQSEDESRSSSKKMLEILQRMEQHDSPDEETESVACEEDLDINSDLDSDDDEQERDLAERLNGVDLDDTDSVWKQLTEAEQKEFNCLVANGDISLMLPLQQCWWTQPCSMNLIRPYDGPSEKSEEMLPSDDIRPKVWDKIPNIKDLYAREPSPMVRFSIANVLAAYSFVYRFYFEGIHYHTLQASNLLITIALSLKKNVVFDSESMAVKSVTNECIEHSLPIDKWTTSILQNHVRLFIFGPPGCGKGFRKLFLLSALSDVRSLLVKGNRKLKTLHERKASGSAKKVETTLNESILFRNSQKKIEFFLAYVASDFF